MQGFIYIYFFLCFIEIRLYPKIYAFKVLLEIIKAYYCNQGSCLKYIYAWWFLSWLFTYDFHQEKKPHL